MPVVPLDAQGRACERDHDNACDRTSTPAPPAMNAAEHLLGAQALALHGERVALLCGETR